MAYHHGNLREALLERAAEVIAERGIEALSLRALARDLGVSHAAPSAHFPDRKALLCELAKEGFRRSAAAAKAGAAAAGPDPVARYRALGRSYVQFARDNRSYYLATRHPEVRALADDDLLEAELDLFRILREGAVAAQAAGWHPEADTGALVAFSIAAAIGTAELLVDSNWSSLLGVNEVDAMADAMLDLIVHRNRIVALPEAERDKIDARKVS